MRFLFHFTRVRLFSHSRLTLITAIILTKPYTATHLSTQVPNYPISKNYLSTVNASFHLNIYTKPLAPYPHALTKRVRLYYPTAHNSPWPSSSSPHPYSSLSARNNASLPIPTTRARKNKRKLCLPHEARISIPPAGLTKSCYARANSVREVLSLYTSASLPESNTCTRLCRYNEPSTRGAGVLDGWICMGTGWGLMRGVCVCVARIGERGFGSLKLYEWDNVKLYFFIIIGIIMFYLINVVCLFLLVYVQIYLRVYLFIIYITCVYIYRHVLLLHMLHFTS